MFGNLLSSASSLIGGLLGQSEQNKINQQQIQFATEQASGQFMPAYLSNLVSGAKAAGLSPLAVLGTNAPSAPLSLGDSNPLGNAVAQGGQNIGRAMDAFADSNSKRVSLQNELLQSQIDSTKADTVMKLGAAGKVAATHGQPGSPPTANPLLQKFDDGTISLSRGASESVMNAASWPMAPFLGAKMVGANLDSWWHSHVRPDIQRAVNNINNWYPSLPDAGAGAWTN